MNGRNEHEEGKDESSHHNIAQLCLKILTKFLLLSLRVDDNFETFDNAFLRLENSNKFLPILFIM